jgi:hypothetical protein
LNLKIPEKSRNGWHRKGKGPIHSCVPKKTKKIKRTRYTLINKITRDKVLKETKMKQK